MSRPELQPDGSSVRKPRHANEVVKEPVMSIRCIIPLLALVAGTTPSIAQDIVRLSPADRESALEAAATRAPINGAPGIGDGRIHGEVGLTVGSDGGRAIYGTTAVPLGDNAMLGFSFVDAQGGRWRGH